MIVQESVKPSVDFLKEIKLFRPFNEQELTELLSLGRVVNRDSHANIIIEGELSWGLYILLEGMVGIFKSNKLTGEFYDVGQLRSGSFFGEMSLVDDHPRSATVRALSDCVLFEISKEKFISFLNRTNDRKIRFFESCVKDLVVRLRELDENFVTSQYQLWKIAITHKEAA